MGRLPVQFDCKCIDPPFPNYWARPLQWKRISYPCCAFSLDRPFSEKVTFERGSVRDINLGLDFCTVTSILARITSRSARLTIFCIKAPQGGAKPRQSPAIGCLMHEISDLAIGLLGTLAAWAVAMMQRQLAARPDLPCAKVFLQVAPLDQPLE